MRPLLFSLIFFVAAQAQSAYNFHEIDPGKFYRSEQLNMRDFEKYLKKYGFKTIVNLRGPRFKDYEAQKYMAEQYGAKYYTISHSAKTIPTRENLLALLDAFETGERPIYVHCKGGADRTGEASALYQLLYMHKTMKQALKMLTVKYLHFKMFYPAKTYFIKKVWGGLDWAVNEYEPCSGQYKYFDVAANCSY